MLKFPSAIKFEKHCTITLIYLHEFVNSGAWPIRMYTNLICNAHDSDCEGIRLVGICVEFCSDFANNTFYFLLHFYLLLNRKEAED